MWIATSDVMRFRSLLLLSLPLAAVLVVSPASAQTPPPETFTEEMEVREIGLVVELPESVSRLRELALDAGDLLVSVDGRLQPASRLLPLGSFRSRDDRTDWTVAVYVDEVLAPPDTVFYAALALAKRAERLAGMGEVEVAVAAPGTRVELAPSREPLRIGQVLSDLVARAGRRRDAAAAQASAPDVAALRRQHDRLLTWMSAPRPPGPRVLFLIADGFPVTPEEMRDLETGAVTDASGRAAVILETARMLAAYGWITVPMPFREPTEEERWEPAQTDSDLDRFRIDHQGASRHSSAVPPVSTYPKRPPSPFRWEAAVNLQIRPDLSSLRALVPPTAGELVGMEPLLDPVLDDLEGRWQLWFQAPLRSDGREQPLRVHLRNGTELRTRTWIRSSTPDEVAAARLRTLLLAGRSEPGTLPLRLDRGVSPAGRLDLRLLVDPFQSSGPVAAGPVRVSWAFVVGESEPVVHHEQVAGIAETGEGWSHPLTLEVPAGARRLVVAVDDLARERWSGAVLDLP
jgi:hypothetical protein